MRREDLLVFDADDTLWESGLFFRRAGEDFIALLEGLGHDREQMTELVHRRDIERLGVTGYGAEPYIDTLEHVLAEVCPQPDAATVRALEDIARALLQHPVMPYPGVRETLTALGGRGYRMIVYTMGQQGHQGDKFARSGLSHHFERCCIVPRKTPDALERTLRSLGVPGPKATVIGNSARSDINPALAVGARAIHIPNEVPWAAELQPFGDPTAVEQLTRFAELTQLLQ